MYKLQKPINVKVITLSKILSKIPKSVCLDFFTRDVTKNVAFSDTTRGYTVKRNLFDCGLQSVDNVNSCDRH